MGSIIPKFGYHPTPGKDHSWKSYEAFGTLERKSRPSRIKAICQHINDNHDVEGLCKEFPMRLQMLVDAEGGRFEK